MDSGHCFGPAISNSIDCCSADVQLVGALACDTHTLSDTHTHTRTHMHSGLLFIGARFVLQGFHFRRSSLQKRCDRVCRECILAREGCGYLFRYGMSKLGLIVICQFPIALSLKFRRQCVVIEACHRLTCSSISRMLTRPVATKEATLS